VDTGRRPSLLYRRRDDEVLDVEELRTQRMCIYTDRDGVFVAEYGNDGEDLDEILPLLRSCTVLWALECGGV
jgi:hypothetical protein